MSIKNTFNRGILYTAISKYLGILITILITIILARILSPNDFGIVAIVTVFSSFFNNLSNMGLGMAVIQNQNLNKEDISSIFSLSIFIGLGFSAIFFFLATPIATFYERSELVNIIYLLSLGVLFASFQTVPNSLAFKNLLFKEIGIYNVFIQLFSGLGAILLAYKGFGYYALILKIVIDTFLTFIMYYYINSIQFTFNIKASSINKVIRFSAFQFLFNFINYFSRNSDNFLIGKYFGVSSLGFYDTAYKLMMMPIQNLTDVISPVVLPVLSKYQSDREMIYNTYIKLVKVLATIGFPLSVFLYFSADYLVIILFGNQWYDSIPIFKILSLTIGIQMILSSSGSIFQTLDETRLLFYSGLISAIVVVSAIFYGVFIGCNLESVGYGLLAAYFINFLQGFYFLIKIGLRHNLGNFFLEFVNPIKISLILLFSFLVLNRFIDFKNIYLGFVFNSLVFIIILILGVFFSKEKDFFKSVFLKNI